VSGEGVLTGDVFSGPECEGAAQFVDRLLNDAAGRDVDVETDALLDMMERIVASHVEAARADLGGRIEALVEEYIPAIKAQLVCSSRARCGCTFCDFIDDLRALLPSSPAAGGSELHREWGVAEVQPDGFVNPSQVAYASSREGAEHKANARDQTAVTRLAGDWAAVAPEGGGRP
jgi:hypothetical protein